MNSLWLVICSLAAFAAAYHFYGASLVAKVAALTDCGLALLPRRKEAQ